MSKVQEGLVLHIRNYKMFRLNPANRPVDSAKLEKLVAAIQKKNWLHAYPINVSKEMEVIDGQHRLKAAERLGLEVYFQIINEMTIEDAAEINQQVTKWTLAGWLHHFCALGKIEYLTLRGFVEEFPWLSVSQAARLCNQGGGGVTRKAGDLTFNEMFGQGHYAANNIHNARRVARMAVDFKKWVTFWKDGAFMKALRNLSNNADYDHERMMGKMEYMSTRLVRCVTAEEYIALMNEIYNWKVTAAHRVRLTMIGYNDRRFRR